MSQYITEENLAIIQSMTLMDDIFMTVFFRNHPECVQEILDAVGINAKVQSVDTQYALPNIHGHSVTMDIKAINDDNSVCNIEIQKRSDGANPKRARFHSSMLDIVTLKPREDYDKLSTSYVIFITKSDVLGFNQPFYKISRVISELNEPFNDGSNIIYINTAYKGKDNSKIVDLIHDFRCAQANEIINENIRNRFNEVKARPTKEEAEYMSELLEKRLEKEKKEKEKEIARKMLLSGKVAVELIAEFCNLTVSEVLALKNPA